MTAKKQAPGLMSRMGESVKHAASSFMLKTRDQEFTDISDFAKNFNEKLISMEKVTDKLARERFGKLFSQIMLAYNLLKTTSVVLLLLSFGPVNFKVNIYWSVLY